MYGLKALGSSPVKQNASKLVVQGSTPTHRPPEDSSVKRNAVVVSIASGHPAPCKYTETATDHLRYTMSGSPASPTFETPESAFESSSSGICDAFDHHGKVHKSGTGMGISHQEESPEHFILQRSVMKPTTARRKIISSDDEDDGDHAAHQQPRQTALDGVRRRMVSFHDEPDAAGPRPVDTDVYQTTPNKRITKSKTAHGTPWSCFKPVGARRGVVASDSDGKDVSSEDDQDDNVMSRTSSAHSYDGTCSDEGNEVDTYKGKDLDKYDSDDSFLAPDTESVSEYGTDSEHTYQAFDDDHEIDSDDSKSDDSKSDVSLVKERRPMALKRESPTRRQPTVTGTSRRRPVSSDSSDVSSSESSPASSRNQRLNKNKDGRAGRSKPTAIIIPSDDDASHVGVSGLLDQFSSALVLTTNKPRKTATGSGTGSGTGRASPTAPSTRRGKGATKKSSTTGTTSSTGTASTAARPSASSAGTAPAPAPPVVGGAAAAALAAAPARKTRMTAAEKQFLEDRPALAQTLYNNWNAEVFGGRLPADLPLVWNPRLVSTAGQVIDDGSKNAAKTRHGQRIPCRLELSSKILNTMSRVRATLSHEMCHVAQWAIDSDFDQPHGHTFWKWAEAIMAYEKKLWLQRTRGTKSVARSSSAYDSPLSVGGSLLARTGLGGAAQSPFGRAATAAPLISGKGATRKSGGSAAVSSVLSMERVAGFVLDPGAEVDAEGPLEISRLHNFETHMPFRWQCANKPCSKVYSRHRNSIDPSKHVCSLCKGRLTFLGKFNKDNKLVQAPTPATGLKASVGIGSFGSPRRMNSSGAFSSGMAAATPAPAPAKTPAQNAYRQFVKDNYAALKAEHPQGTPMPTIMKALAAQWTTVKAQNAAGAAGGGGNAPPTRRPNDVSSPARAASPAAVRSVSSPTPAVRLFCDNAIDMTGDSPTRERTTFRQVAFPPSKPVTSYGSTTLEASAASVGGGTSHGMLYSCATPAPSARPAARTNQVRFVLENNTIDLLDTPEQENIKPSDGGHPDDDNHARMDAFAKPPGTVSRSVSMPAPKSAIKQPLLLPPGSAVKPTSSVLLPPGSAMKATAMLPPGARTGMASAIKPPVGAGRSVVSTTVKPLNSFGSSTTGTTSIGASQGNATARKLVLTLDSDDE